MLFESLSSCCVVSCDVSCFDVVLSRKNDFVPQSGTYLFSFFGTEEANILLQGYLRGYVAITYNNKIIDEPLVF